ncbi:ABC transporter permease [Actinocatenispora comari]|jgi:ABC-2 type transport system permease protein|uniref:Transport permease protein n=1 Tax=Actinocatenispora comari TaxID=2807577 RepID=A0A8J4AI37_9ACTN|nr:ABC transporter permease [Actinocatenispora comari]GIL30990.1 transport permease protein [Actinocatenispora comari]
MTTPFALPAASAGALARLGWTLADGWTLARREFAQLRRQPSELVTMLAVPAMLVLLFGYVFGGSIQVPGDGDYRSYLMPGMFAMVALLGVASSATMIATDIGAGVMDRFRSLPMARSAVPLGRAVADLLTGAAGIAVMAGLGLAVGWRPHGSVAATAAGFALVLLLRFATTWVGITIGLSVPPATAEAMVPVVFPVTMLSNSFVPTDGMPAWLRTVCDWNPVSSLVAACRDLFGNPGGGPHPALPEQHPVAVTLLWAGVLLAVFVPLATARYRASGR